MSLLLVKMLSYSRKSMTIGKQFLSFPRNSHQLELSTASLYASFSRLIQLSAIFDIFYILTDYNPLLGVPVKLWRLPHVKLIIWIIWCNSIQRNWQRACWLHVSWHQCFLQDPFLEYPPFVDKQVNEQSLQQLLRNNSTSLKFSNVHIPNFDLDVICNTSTRHHQMFLRSRANTVNFILLHTYFISVKCKRLNTISHEHINLVMHEV